MIFTETAPASHKKKARRDGGAGPYSGLRSLLPWDGSKLVARFLLGYGVAVHRFLVLDGQFAIA